MSCKKLYLEHPAMESCTAVVLQCQKEAQGTYAIETDQTPLFPEGGGQRSDLGWINKAPVLHCFEQDGTVFHRTEVPFAPGDTVTLQVDGETRRAHTQQHNGEHMLSYAYYKLYGAENIGFHMADGFVTIDLDRNLSDEQITAGEQLANRMVWSDGPVEIFHIDAKDMEKYPLRKKNERLAGDVRIVSICGEEMCTCCGTHFTHTAPVGMIKVLEHAKYKQGCRITFACGAWAWAQLDAENRVLRRAAARLSVKPEEIADAVERREQRQNQLQLQLRQKNQQLAALMAQQLLQREAPLIRAVLPLDVAALKIVADTVCAQSDKAVLLFCAEEDRLRFLAMAGKDSAVDCKALAQQLSAQYGAKGGGSAKLAQGSLVLSPEQQKKLEEDMEPMEAQR